MNDKTKTDKNKIIGIWYAIAAFTAWGFLPLYWKLLKRMPAAEILSHRIFWSFVLVTVILIINKRWSNIRQVLSDRRKRFSLLLSSLLISANWFIYIWAVNDNHIVEASLGYYINPLLTIFLGMLVLKERLTFWQLISLFLALAGVLVVTLEYGQVPWIALSLALTFALYGLVKKIANLDSMTGLAVETGFVVPIALSYLIYKQIQGTASFGTAPTYITLLIIGSGIATALPLIWFAHGATRVPLSTVGFIQYLAPTISLIIGLAIFHEPFTKPYLLSFALIWSALILYSLSQTNLMSKMQPQFGRPKASKNEI